MVMFATKRRQAKALISFLERLFERGSVPESKIPDSVWLSEDFRKWNHYLILVVGRGKVASRIINPDAWAFHFKDESERRGFLEKNLQILKNRISQNKETGV